MMAFSVMISLFVGLVVGCASMALWAARRIGDEAARQFDRGFERGRWLADVSTTGGLEPVGRTRRILIVPGAPPAAGGEGRGARYRRGRGRRRGWRRRLRLVGRGGRGRRGCRGRRRRRARTTRSGRRPRRQRRGCGDGPGPTLAGRRRPGGPPTTRCLRRAPGSRAPARRGARGRLR